MLLEVTRKTRFLPGSNLKGEPAGAAWVFLLDQLELGRTLCLGALRPSNLAMLAPLADEVMVWEPHASKRRELLAWLDRAGHRNISLAARPQASWQLHELRADLVVRTGRDPAWSEEALQPFLHGHSRFYCETHERLGWRRSCPQQSSPSPGEPGSTWLRLTPTHGEIRSALPSEDESTFRYFARRKMHGTSSRFPWVARVQSRLSRQGLLPNLHGRVGLLRGRDTGPFPAAPAYLRRLARQHGLDFEGHRWGFWARGDYLSQKVLFYLFANEDESPQAVVKLVRNARFNGRLENEYRALSRLRSLPAPLRKHVPEPLFLGHPGTLAAVGECMIDGEPFKGRTDGSASCPLLHGALRWLTEVAQATAEPVSPARAAEALQALFARFQEIYPLEAAERAFLQGQISRVAASPQDLPAVVQHGDPGPWNLFVQPGGEVVFLDWEGAEERGMPLWDLLYFLRSFVLLGRVRGLQSRLDSFSQTFLQESPLSSMVLEAVERYCERSGLDRSLVEPLFYTCWMHRALKESARLPESKLAQGRFFQLLRHCMARPEAPGLRRLFASTQSLQV